MDSEDEDPLAAVRRADFRRAEQSRLNRKTQSAKVSPNPLGASDFVSPRREHAADIFDEAEPGPRLDEDAPRVGPQVPFVEPAALAPGKAVRLARDAANDAIHKAAPASAVKGSHIAPDRRRSQETRFHRRDQMGDGEGFPLHHKHGASARNGELDGKVESAAAAAERDIIEPSAGGT